MNLEARHDAIRSLSTLLARGDTWHTPRFYDDIAKRLVANALLVKAYLTPVAEAETVTLRQQQYQRYDDLDWIEELVHHLRRELADAEATWERVKARRVAEHDPDVVRQDREDDRARAARQDEHAVENAPEVKAS